MIADQRDGARLTRCDIGAFEFAACLLIGDVDDDGDVDVTDISAVANAWLDPALNPVLDITISGYIDVIDATATASRFGLVCS